MSTPTAYESAARKAAGQGDFAAAARLELSGRGVTIGHKRRDRHEQRAEEYARLAGMDPDLVGFATEADKAKYLD